MGGRWGHAPKSMGAHSSVCAAAFVSLSLPLQTTVTVLVDGLGNGLLVLLLVLYLLAEQSSHSAASLRARVDDQIQRYIGIKTVISAMQGLLVYLIMGTLLHVRMAHLFGVLHFLLNFIPTVRCGGVCVWGGACGGGMASRQCCVERCAEQCAE